MYPTTYAVIPARGGSKGLPGKNLRLLEGRPLVARTVEAARQAALVERVFVSTDSEEIARAARRAGAEIIVRPAELSSDTASSEAALLHALESLQATEGHLPDILVFLQCTSPFLLPVDIDGTIQALEVEGADSALAAVPFCHFLWRQGPEGALGVNHDGRLRLRRQDLAPEYLEAGSVYAMRVPAFLKEKTRFCGRTALHVSKDSHRCLEIDEAADLYAAEAMASWFAKTSEARENWRRGEPCPLPARLGALVCDFDGVWTDNAVWTGQNGEESVRCDRGDGAGLAALKRQGLPVLVLSAEENPVVAARCRKTGALCLQGVRDKTACLDAWLKARGLSWEEVIYAGNDLADLDCLRKAGLGVVPADAHPSVRGSADLVLPAPGGHGALRGLCDRICAALEQGLTRIAGAGKEAVVPYYAGQSDLRPWGSWTVLAAWPGCCVKEIRVLPGGVLSLQAHRLRDEFWQIVRGRAEVTLEDRVFAAGPGDQVRILRGQKHRIRAEGAGELVFVEIQNGEAPAEDDIVRLEDSYGRCGKGGEGEEGGERS